MSSVLILWSTFKLATPTRLQMGVSLIELLIALALGLGLLVGLALYYQQTTLVAEQTAREVRLELEGARVFAVVNDAIEVAGFVPSSLAGNDKTLLFQADADFAAGQVIVSTGSDVTTVLTVRALASEKSPIKTCLGQRINEDRMITMQFYLKDQNFYCESQAVLRTNITNIIKQEGILAKRVAQFRLSQYGIDTTLGGKVVISNKPTPLTVQTFAVLVELVITGDNPLIGAGDQQRVTYFDNTIDTFLSRRQHLRVMQKMVAYNEL